MSQVANTWSNTVVKNIVRTMPPMDNTSSTMWWRAPAGLTNKEKELFSLALNFLSHCVYLLWPYSIILHYHALNCTLRLCFNSVGKYNFNFGLSRHERHNISDQTNQLQLVALTSCRGLSKFLLLILLLSYFYYYCYYYCFYYYCCYYDYHLVQLYISCRTCLHHMTSQISV